MTKYTQASDLQLTQLLDELTLSGSASHELSRLVHELQVNQSELEQQNRELREVRAVLEESRERYADLYDFAPVGYLSLDAAGVVRAINLTGAAQLGRSRGRILGRSLAGFVVPEDRRILRAHIAETLQAPERRMCELQMLPSETEPTRDGPVMMLESLLEGGSSPAQIRAILTDITERKQADQERRERAAAVAAAASRHRLISGLERLSAAATRSFDPDTTLNELLRVVQDILQVDRAWLLYPCDPAVTLVNVRAEVAVPGCPGETRSGRSIPVDPSLRALSQLALTGSGAVVDPYPGVTTALGGGFAPRSRLVVPVCPRGDRTYLLGLHRCRIERDWKEEDLELVQAIAERLAQIMAMLAVQKALTESEERFRATFEQAAVGICHIDHRGWFIRVNNKLCDILGYSEEELLNYAGLDLTHPSDRNALQNYFAQVKAGKGESSSLELRNIDKQGLTIWCNLTMAARKDAEGRFKYFIAVIEDISARKALQDRDHRHRDALARATRISTIGEMSSAIAHEITQPLMAISTYVGGALQRLDNLAAKPDEREVELLRDVLLEISRLADRAGHIIDRIRNFSSQRSPKPQVIDLRTISREAISMVESEFKARRTAIDVNCPADLPSAVGDPIELEQVLVNLLLNGLEAMKETPVARRQLSVEITHADANQIRVSVADRGVGFTAGDMMRVFDPFFTTKVGGTGLGLPVCRSILESYGGRIWVEPRPGGGAVFAFTLPGYAEDHIR